MISEELAFLLQKLIPALNEGVLMSIKLIVPSAVLGLALGVVVGSLRAYGGRFVSPLANGYAALAVETNLLVAKLSLLGLGLCLFAFAAKPIIGYLVEVSFGIQ